jgi:hypothetical protein
MTPDKANQLGNDLCCLAASIAEIGEELKALYDFDSQDREEDVPERETPIAEPMPEPPKAPTLEEVRAVLGDKSHNGFQEEVRALITKRSAVKLSDIDPSEYSALLKEAEALN